MKVLHASCFLEYDYGGAEQVTRRLLTLLPPSRVAGVLCLEGGTRPCEAPGAVRLPAPVTERSTLGQAYKRYILFAQNQAQHRRWQRETVSRLDLSQFDLIHCHDTHWLGTLVPLAARHRIPVVVTCHQNLPFRLILGPRARALEKLINANLKRRDRFMRAHLRACAAVATPSRFCANAMVEFLAGECPPLTVVPNWADSYLLEAPPSASQPLPRTAVYVGRMAGEKGVQLILDAVRGFADGGVTLVGANGPLVQAVRNAPGVKWVEQVPHRELVSFVQRFEAALCPSLVDESFGRTALEYRLADVKIVATRSGGIPEILEDYPGVFWTGKSAAELREALARAWAAPQVKEPAEGRERFIARYRPEAAVALYEAIYRRLAGRRGAA